jgi:hypothetical protein
MWYHLNCGVSGIFSTAAIVVVSTKYLKGKNTLKKSTVPKKAIKVPVAFTSSGGCFDVDSVFGVGI